MKTSQLPGSYGYDKTFFKDNRIGFIELHDEENLSKLIIVPAWQARVMTSTTRGDAGFSHGWINYGLIRSGKINNKFNAFGGEERFWLGPEGGPFSIYFDRDMEQVPENWRVPALIDTEPFVIISVLPKKASFRRKASIENASGFVFYMEIERTISLISRNDVAHLTGFDLPQELSVVAYETFNRITNTGREPWRKETGLISIWLLSMLHPSKSTTAFIPFQKEASGKILNDDYFGKIPDDRLIVVGDTIYFRVDGRQRGKIGLPWNRATQMAGSYNAEENLITILWYNRPKTERLYVNSQWGKQTNPFDGDVINAYNDGPMEDGSIFGPFYELETSSPGAELNPGDSIEHIQRIIHISGSRESLSKLFRDLFNHDLQEVSEVFKNSES
jgi:hypothetical protein